MGKQMQRDALRRARAETGELAEGADQLVEWAFFPAGAAIRHYSLVE